MIDYKEEYKVYFDVLKWTAGILVTLGAVAGVWALLFSSYLANISFVIPLRLSFQENLWAAQKLIIKPVRRVPPFDPIYTIQVQAPENGHYVYALWGKFDSVDINTDIVKLKGFDGNTYTFVVGNNWKEIDNGSLGLPPAKPFDTVFINNHINVDTSPYTKDSVIVIRWDDARTLYQLEREYAADPAIPLNKNSKLEFSFSKYNQGK